MTESCPSGSQLARSLTRSLGDHETWVTAHVASCERCQVHAETLDASNLSTLAEPPFPGIDAGGGVTLESGTRVGRYVVEGMLGQGGMGRVYLALDPELNRKVALKLLLPAASSARAESRLLREAQSMALLAHPNVVAAYDVGRHEGRVFVAMELVPGKSLKAWLEEAKRDLREVVKVFMAAAEGLAAAHQAGLVHRDFKPANVLVGDDGRTRVADFGIARGASTAVDERDPPDAPACGPAPELAAPLTAAGAIVGTIGYLAPEAASTNPPDARADQFSFCASLYEAVCHRQPFPASNVIAYIAAIQEGLPAVQPKTAAMPGWLYRCLVKGLSARPEQRYPDMRALVAALERGLFRRRRVMTGAGALAALAAASLFAARPWTRPPRNCDGEVAVIDEAWNAAVRDRIASAFETSKAPANEKAAALISARIDGYVRRWKAQARTTCAQLAADERAATNDGLLPAAHLCLDQRRLDLQALVQVVAAPETAKLGGGAATAAANQLEDPQSCSDAGFLRTSGMTAPLTQQQRAVAARLAEPLAKARAYCVLHRFPECIRFAKQIEAEASANDLLNLQASALAMYGAAVQFMGEPPGDSLSRAQTLALRAGNVELAVLVGFDLMRTALAKDGPAAAGRILETLKQLAAGISEASWVGVGLHSQAAAVMAAEGNFPIALAEYRKAIDLGRKALGPDHPWVLGDQIALAGTLVEAGDLPASLKMHEDLLNTIEAAYGTQFTPYCVTANNLTYIWTILGRYDDALRLITTGIECVRATYGDVPVVAVYLANRAYTLVRMGRGAEGLAAAEEAAARGGKDAEGDARFSLLFSVRGVARTLAGRSELGLPDCRRALALDEKAKQNFAVVDDLFCEGRALLALGRAREAVAALARASVIGEAAHQPSGNRSDVHFALAQATWKATRDRGRASALAKQALHELDDLPARHRDRQEIENFLRANGWPR